MCTHAMYKSRHNPESERKHTHTMFTPEMAKRLSEHLSQVRLLELIHHAITTGGNPDAHTTLFATAQERVTTGMGELPAQLTQPGHPLSSSTKSMLKDFLTNQWKAPRAQLAAKAIHLEGTTSKIMQHLSALAADNAHLGHAYLNTRSQAILSLQMRLILQHTIDAKATGAAAPSHAFFERLLCALVGLEFDCEIAGGGRGMHPNAW